MEINLKPEDIDNLVKETILKSMIGGVIVESIKKALNLDNWDNPVDAAIKMHVRQIAMEVFTDEYKEEIRGIVKAAIEKRISSEVLHEVVDKFLLEWERKMERC